MNAVSLPAICDRAAARSVLPDFVDAVGETKITVDASAVERMGQAMLQLLISAFNTESGISLKAPSEPFLMAIRLAGLEARLGADIEEATAQ